MENFVGGLARSLYSENGFTYDIGGHVSYTHDTAYWDFLDSLDIEYNKFARKAKVFC